ncbi:MAG TPA: hypothetical protein VEZ11_03460 [Thermoanaerobaculia bacterium]|nr:hypothetical protein [Thermoanaerobaculia bacterium]
MRTTIAVLLLSGLTLALVAASPKSPPTDTPEALIKSLYAAHQPGKEKSIDWCDRKSISRFCDAELTDLFIKDCECSRKTEGICNLDWDPFYAAQDFGEDDPNPRIKRLQRAGRVVLEVTIKNFKDVTLIYEMKQTKAGWRVSDITSTNDKWTLTKVLSGQQ